MSDTLLNLYEADQEPPDPTAHHPIVDGDDADIVDRRTVADLDFDQLQEFVTVLRARRERYVARIKAASSGDGIAKTTAKMRALLIKANKQVKKFDELAASLDDTIVKMRALYIQLGDTPPHEPS